MSTINESQEFVFDLAPQSILVKIGSVSYVLKEATEDAARKYRNACVSAARMTDGKVTGIEGIANVQAFLVSLCLSELNDRGEELKLIPEALVRQLPARVVRPLFDWIRGVSLLDEEPAREREQSKNSQKNTKPTSD